VRLEPIVHIYARRTTGTIIFRQYGIFSIGALIFLIFLADYAGKSWYAIATSVQANAGHAFCNALSAKPLALLLVLTLLMILLTMLILR